MKKFEAVGQMVELESGLTKEQIVNLLSMLPDGEELIPFEASENNSTIFGFITVEAADEHMSSVESLAIRLCEDFDNETTDKTYQTKSGLTVFIDCEYETVRGEKELRTFSSDGDLVNVQTTETLYRDVVVCPKPNTPAIHMIGFTNGDAVEVKTADIISVDKLPF